MKKLLLVFCSFAALHGEAATARPMKAVWLWGSTVRGMGNGGARSIARDLRRFGFTDIFLLVKGESGQVSFRSRTALSLSEQDVLADITREGHRNNLKVHAWFVVNSDAAYGAAHPDEVMVHLRNGPTQGKISPLAPGYRKYIAGLVREVIDGYPVDGVHLDYIRYGHAAYSFDAFALKQAQERGIDVDRVKSILNQAFYETKDSSIVLQSYRNRDAALAGWTGLRRDTIVDFARSIRKIVKAAKRPLQFSAALMPEGAYDPAFGDIYYAQNYADAASLYDFVAPMTYWKEFSKAPEWVGTVVKEAVAVMGGKPVMAGVQAFGGSGSRDLAAAEESARAAGSGGTVYFRYGSFAFASVRVKRAANGRSALSLEILNRSGSPADRCRIDFQGTGLMPTAVREAPKGAACQVSESAVTLDNEHLVAPGETLKLLTEAVRNTATNTPGRMPLIDLSLDTTPIPVMLGAGPE